MPDQLVIDDTTYKSPNFDVRALDISMITLHSTGDDNAHGTTSYLCNPTPINPTTGKPDTKLAVSAQLVIWQDGRCFQLVPDDKRAWTNGASKFGDISDTNSASLSVELVNLNNGRDPYPQAQVDALRNWCEWKMRQYNIPVERVVRHLDICVPKDRKTDPAGFDFDAFKKSLTFTLTENDVWSKWGTAFPIYDDVKHFGIPQTWLANADKLGEARSNELYGDDGSAQVFQHGYVGWSKASNRTRVVLFASSDVG